MVQQFDALSIALFRLLCIMKEWTYCCTSQKIYLNTLSEKPQSNYTIKYIVYMLIYLHVPSFHLCICLFFFVHKIVLLYVRHRSFIKAIKRCCIIQGSQFQAEQLEIYSAQPATWYFFNSTNCRINIQRRVKSFYSRLQTSLVTAVVYIAGGRLLNKLTSLAVAWDINVLTFWHSDDAFFSGDP